MKKIKSCRVLVGPANSARNHRIAVFVMAILQPVFVFLWPPLPLIILPLEFGLTLHVGQPSNLRTFDFSFSTQRDFES